MRAILTAAALLMLPVAGHAQIAVQDNASILQQLKDYELQFKTWVLDNTTALHEAATDLNTAQTYAQELEMYVHMVENPTLAVSTILNQIGLGSDLPVNPMQIMTLANGFHATNGGSLMADLAQLRMLAGFTSGAFAENHVYTCAYTDPACSDMNARANGIAGSMGLAQAAYADLQAHQATLAGLRDDLSGTTDPAQRETLIAQIGIEQAYVENTQARLNAATAQANLAQQSASQRILERQRASADAYFAETQPMTVAAPSAPAPPLFAAN